MYVKELVNWSRIKDVKSEIGLNIFFELTFESGIQHQIPL